MIAGEHFCSRGFHSAKEVKTVGPATPGFVLGSRLVFSYGESGGLLVHGTNLSHAGQKSAWGKRPAPECRSNPDFPEARFWIASRLPTIRELMTTSALLGPDPGGPVTMDGGPAEMNSLYMDR